MFEKTLPSGAILKFNLASFTEGRALYQACLEELKSLSLDPEKEIDSNLFKDIFCAALSSKKIESCVWACFKRATLSRGSSGDLKIDESSFESLEARQDYIPACFEVAKENIVPFAKSLYAEFRPLLDKIRNSNIPA